MYRNGTDKNLRDSRRDLDDVNKSILFSIWEFGDEQMKFGRVFGKVVDQHFSVQPKKQFGNITKFLGASRGACERHFKFLTNLVLALLFNARN